ncbi:MAG TPA: DUF4394 domain-containing protein [Pyrinomonadaceae bacterium]|jgi:hypothetical protein
MDRLFLTSRCRRIFKLLLATALLLACFTLAQAVPMVGITISNKLVRFDSNAPGNIISMTDIFGLQVGEQIQAIDFRPATGQLYGVGSSHRLYLINQLTGVATPVSPTPFNPPLNGTFFDADFNPLTDRLRVVSDADQNLRLDPETGTAILDQNLAFASNDVNAGLNPEIVGLAYSPTTSGNPSTTAYAIDWIRDVLVIQGGPNGTPDNGQLNTRGALGFDTTAYVGFDIAPGSGTAYASLTLQNDTVSRLFTLNLATGAATQVGAFNTVDFIRDIAVAPVGTFQFNISSATVSENAGKVTLTVIRSGDLSGPASVDYATSDGTASQRGDYLIAFGTLNFSAGESSQSFDVLIVDDAYVEASETFNVSLSSPTGGFFAGLNNTATVTITDNDTVSNINPIDDAAFFVRQHYLDFLNREPDAGGLAYWTNEINKCGSDASCIERRRVAVSAAFFLSNEFQETGYFVYRLYKAAFDGADGTRPAYLEFMRDRSRLLVGSNLEALKTALVNDFVTRSEFLSIYQGLNNAAYVDRLNANTGNSLTRAERDALVQGLNAFFPTETRATVLRKIVDNAVFKQRQLNPSFVLMEYFGYLRRDPDPGGYQFWLNILNNTGNYRGMVCAFITSREYQERFSPVRTRTDQLCAGL